MLFWIVAGILALAVAGVVAGAVLRRPARAARSAAESDLIVYKDQLAEVDRDLARGVLTASEAEAIRVEVSRRLLDADRRAQAEVAAGDRSAAPITGAVLAGVAIIAGAFGLYSVYGRPGAADLPLAERIARAEEFRANRPAQEIAEAEVGEPAAGLGDPQFETLMDRLRATVAERPDDVQGLTLLARNEARQQRFISARKAQERLVAAKGESAEIADYEELLTYLFFAAGGYVSPEAEAVSARIGALDPGNPTARYYEGLLYAQTGRPDRAFALWRDLLENGPADAPWMASIRGSIVELAAAAGVRYTPPAGAVPALPGPSASDVANAQDMTAEDRTAMIRSMVDGLSNRLATEGGSAAEWARLIRALGVLGETDRASAIVAEARDVFAANDTDLAAIEAAAREAGIE